MHRQTTTEPADPEGEADGDKAVVSTNSLLRDGTEPFILRVGHVQSVELPEQGHDLQALLVLYGELPIGLNKPLLTDDEFLR